jgi:excisionase family DNA binding protein
MGATSSPLDPASANTPYPVSKTLERPERLLTAQEVADWLGVSARWVLSHASGVNRPVLPSLKLGKAVRFDRTAVEEFIRQCARMNRCRVV